MQIILYEKNILNNGTKRNLEYKESNDQNPVIDRPDSFDSSQEIVLQVRVEVQRL